MTTSSLTGIIDYGLGNVRSVQSAVEKVGGRAILTSNHDMLLECDRLILPGVGAFSHGMSELQNRGLDLLIKRAVAEGTPLLGICLGMQMLTHCSYEFGETTGLAITDGAVSLIQKVEDSSLPIRLPHVAWKSLRRISDSQNWFFNGIDQEARFYFIHSFAVQSDSAHAIACASHEGVEFAAVIARGNVIGTQFHPEKSGADGLRMLGNFISKGK
jgi:glutamine amidotransferase